MSLAVQQGISLSTSKHTWEEIDDRCKQLGLNRSKYTQMLYELEIGHHILSNHQLLHLIKNPNKKYSNFFNIVVILFLFAILASVLTLGWLLL